MMQYPNEQKGYRYFNARMMHGFTSTPRSCSRYRFHMVKGKFDVVLGKCG